MLEKEINLLSPQAVGLRITRLYLDHAGHLLRFIVFLVGLLLLVLGAVYLVVWRTQASIVEDTVQADKRELAILKQVRTINERVVGIRLWQSEHVPWTPRLPVVLAALPADIVLTRVAVTGEKTVLELGGTFGRRESLVAFQRQLEQLSWVAKVESPLSNFATGSEAKFTLLVHPK